jgi:putative FmdB family regulatory protein
VRRSGAMAFMPTYDYLCDACGHKFELFQSMSDEVQRKCPKCKKMKLRRLFGSGAAVMFKGSGFYTTDYRSDSYKKAASADSANGETKSKDTKTEGTPSSTKSESTSGDKPAKSSRHSEK